MKNFVLALAFASLLPLAANAGQITHGQSAAQTSSAPATVAYNAQRTASATAMDQAQNRRAAPSVMNRTCVDWDAGVCDSFR